MFPATPLKPPSLLERWNTFTKNPFATVKDKLPSFSTSAPEPYYQVRPTDRSMDSIAQKMNLPLQQLVTTNNMKTLPPAGSFIATGVQPARPVGQPYIQAGATPGTRAPIETTSVNGRDQAFTGDIKALQNKIVGNQIAMFQENLDFTGKYNTNLLPKSMTLEQIKANGFTTATDPATGQPMTTQQALAAYGYSFANGVATQTGKPAASSTGGAPAPGQAGYNPSGKGGSSWTLVRTKSGKLVYKRPGVSGTHEDAPIAAAEASNAGGTPTSVLGLRLGSG